MDQIEIDKNLKILLELQQILIQRKEATFQVILYKRLFFDDKTINCFTEY